MRDLENKIAITLILIALTIYSQRLSVGSRFRGYYQAGFVTGGALQGSGALASGSQSIKRPFQVASLAPEMLGAGGRMALDDFNLDSAVPTPVLSLMGGPDGANGAAPDVMALMEQYLAMDEEAFELEPEDIPIPELPEDSGDGRDFTFARHTLVKGESLEELAGKHGVDLKQLAVVNGVSKGQKLGPGDEIIIPLGLGTMHQVRPGDTLWEIGKRYNLKAATLLFFNKDKQDQVALEPGEPIFIPLGVINTSDAEQIAANPTVKRLLENRTAFVWPAHGRLSSGFGMRKDPILRTTRFHRGIDIACPYGRPILAAESGRVVYTGWKGASGITVIIEHANGMHSIYAHCSKTLVERGQWVSSRQPVAKVGSTGRSTGAHLHFALKLKNGTVVNPLKYLDLASL